MTNTISVLGDTVVSAIPLLLKQWKQVPTLVLVPLSSPLTTDFVLSHLQHTGHMQNFVLVSEEAISKGIRRIVAITGPEALKAQKKCEALEEQVENLQNSVRDRMKSNSLKIKETAQEISRLGEVRDNSFI